MIDYEFYETPEAFTRYLFRACPWIEGRLFEPCVGSGAIPRVAVETSTPAVLRDDWYINDLDPRWPADSHLDAREAVLWADVEPEWTVTNPPFSPVMEILPHALQYSRKGVAMHLRASIHEPTKTGVRRSFMREHPPSQILWLPRFGYQRSKKTGEWSTDSVCACWVIWDRTGSKPDQVIRYADEQCLVELAEETPKYRARMDALMAARAA